MKLLFSFCCMLLVAQAWSQKVIFYDKRSDFELKRNEFFVHVKGEDPNNLVFTTDNGEITFRDPWVFYKPYRTGLAMIKVFKKNHVLFDSMQIVVQESITLEAFINGRKGGLIPKGQLLVTGLVVTKFVTERHAESLRVTSYTVVISKQNGEFICLNNEGSFFNEKVKEAIQQSEKGDRLAILNIVTNPSFRIAPLEFIID